MASAVRKSTLINYAFTILVVTVNILTSVIQVLYSNLGMHQGHLQTSWSLTEAVSSLLINWIGLLVQRRDPSHH